MSPALLIAIVAVAVAVVVAVAVTNRRRHYDGVNSFRRQIDALSPEARRSVVDQVQNAAERRDRTDDDPVDADSDDGRADDRADGNGDGPRGT